MGDNMALRHAFKPAILAALVASVAVATPFAASAQEVTLIFGSTRFDHTPNGKIMRDMIPAKLMEHSGGRVTAQVHLGATLCSEHTCVEMAKQGAIDLGNLSTGNIGAFGRTFDFMNLPYLFKDVPEKMLGDWLLAELNTRSEKEMGLHVWGIEPTCGFRHLMQSARELREPNKDTRGIKIRVTKSPTEFQLMKAWGLTPVPYDWAQLYQGLQMGVVQGMYIPHCFLETNKYAEVVKHLTLTRGAWTAQPNIVDVNRYNAYPDFVKDAITKMGMDTTKAFFAADRNWISEMEAILPTRGVKIYRPTPAEEEKWRLASVPVWAEAKSAFDPKIVRRILTEQGLTTFMESLEKEGIL
jgi:TRAP-type C4-dicarboxylate transport system substrate-binding protein